MSQASSEMRRAASYWRQKLATLVREDPDIWKDVPKDVWPWIRLLEKEELEAAGYPAGHITNLPKLDESV